MVDRILEKDFNAKYWRVSMAVYVPSGQTTQLVGLPPLPDSFYEKLPGIVAEVYAEYQEMARQLELEKKHGKNPNGLSKES